MARFEFSLQAVLEQRGWVERERQRALGVLLGEMAGLEAELARLDGMVREASRELRDGRLLGPIDLAFLAGQRRFVLAMERKAHGVMQRMALLQRRIEEARGLLLEAARARKVVEKLRDRRLAAWREEQSRREQRDTDEIGGVLTLLRDRAGAQGGDA